MSMIQDHTSTTLKDNFKFLILSAIYGLGNGLLIFCLFNNLKYLFVLITLLLNILVVFNLRKNSRKFRIILIDSLQKSFFEIAIFFVYGIFLNYISFLVPMSNLVIVITLTILRVLSYRMYSDYCNGKQTKVKSVREFIKKLNTKKTVERKQFMYFVVGHTSIIVLAFVINSLIKEQKITIAEIISIIVSVEIIILSTIHSVKKPSSLGA